MQIHQVAHPLIEHSLTILRSKATSTEVFRRHARIVSQILLFEVTQHLHVTGEAIETPLAPFEGKKLSDDIVLVPVLRAGLAMLFAVQDFLPAVSVGFIGLERDEQTAQARQYYQKLPKLFSTHKVIIIDPMLATGGSFADTVTALKAKNATDITLVSVVSAPEGIARLNKNHPDISLYTAAIDTSLNAQKFIVPGLGDFGDRYFGT